MFSDNYGVCGLREDVPSPIPGWWGPKGTEVTRVHECSVLDRRPGLTFVQYKHPANWSQPDFVSLSLFETNWKEVLEPRTEPGDL